METVPGKATVCIGVRRSGKSTFLFQVIQRLFDGGVPRENILYLNFFDDRLHALRQDRLGLITQKNLLHRSRLGQLGVVGILLNFGHLLENLVFTALRRHHSEIYYYKTKTGREVDFVVPGRDRSRMLVQVCETLVEAQTRKRETSALGEAMAELGQKTGTIVTKNEDERIAIEGGIIEVVPIWRFLLDLPGQASPG